MPNAWPGTLPQKLLLNGASLGVGDGLIEYAPDTGPSITRRRTTAVMRPLQGSMVLTDAQVTIFETFFFTTLLNGALPFTFPDPRTGATLLVKVPKGTPPSYVPQGGDNFVLSLSLTVLP
jgi:hypothetical protein